MKFSVKLILVFLGILLIGLYCIFQMKSTIKEQKESLQTLENNNEQFLKGTRVLETENGNLVYKVNEVTVTNAELDAINKELYKELKNAKVKVRDLESLISLSVSSKDTVTIHTKDTLIQKLPFRTFDYNTKWYQVKGIQDRDITKLEIGCYHDITIANEIIYKGWWIFRKPVKNEVTVIMSNFKDSIQKVQSFYISKKKKKRNN